MDQSRPKIINSLSFNHIKNEEVTGISSTLPIQNDSKQKNSNETQFQKSAYPVTNIQEEEELRTTWKRGPPKINSNKLPQAFQNPVTMKNRQQKVQALGGNKNIPIQRLNELNKIENIEAIQEYKQASSMLSPLKQREGSIPKNQSSKNPLVPLKHFIKNQQRINDELGLNLSTVNQLLQGSIRLDEMITTDVVRSYSDSSPVKKMIHAPTLRFYIVKEEPLQNKEIRKNLKEWISFWQNKFNNSPHHLKVHSTFWNTPEGYVSIVMEYMNGGSLQNLFESVGYLPEKTIKQICQMVIISLQKIHSCGNFCHGGLAPSQVLFTRDGGIKLSLGISYRISNSTQSSFNSLLLGKRDQSLYDPQALEALWGKIYMDKPSETFNFEKANDVMKLGLLMLNCAIGTLEFHSKASSLYEGFRIILSEVHKYAEYFKDTCCVIHSEQQLIQVVEKFFTKGENEQCKFFKKTFNQESKSLLQLLNNGRFSQEFINFLCVTLKIDPRKRASIDELQNHLFLSNKSEIKGPKINLKELIQVSSAWNCQLPEKYQGQGSRKLEKLCEALLLVLSNCDGLQIKGQISEESDIIKELAYDMGLNCKTVSERLGQIFLQFTPLKK